MLFSLMILVDSPGLYPLINKSEVFTYFVKFKLLVKKNSPLVLNNIKQATEVNIPPRNLKIFLSNMGFFIVSLALYLSKKLYC
jgi:hypothetical protein